VGSRSWRNPPSVAQQHITFFTHYPTAHPAGYGTNDVPNPPYIGYENTYIQCRSDLTPVFLDPDLSMHQVLHRQLRRHWIYAEIASRQLTTTFLDHCFKTL
jgi:hypothetical protein